MNEVRTRPTGPVRFPWRWVIESPLLLATWFCLLGGIFTTSELAHGIRRAHQLHAETARAKALLAAEHAAVLVAADPGRLEPGLVVPSWAGFSCKVESVEPGGQLTFRVRDPAGIHYGFACQLLMGGAPAAFGIPFGVGRLPREGEAALTPQPMQLGAADMPRLLSPASDDRSSIRGILVRDVSIGLMRLGSGTDLEDYVFAAPEGDYLQIHAPPDGVLRVGGHLWLDAKGPPVHLRLHRNLTIVVSGNLYLGRSLEVSGPGRLILMARTVAGATYRDMDGNGRWSTGDVLLGGTETAFHGCVEGSGILWLGLPGGSPVEDLRIDACLVAEGEVQLAASHAVVRGPLLTAQGVTAVQGSGLVVTGEYLPEVHREAIPGFAVTGPPRPGALTSVPLASAGDSTPPR